MSHEQPMKSSPKNIKLFCRSYGASRSLLCGLGLEADSLGLGLAACGLGLRQVVLIISLTTATATATTTSTTVLRPLVPER